MNTLKRRTFLVRGGQLALLGTPPARRLLKASTPAFLARREEDTLSAVLDLVLPSGADSPGARDVRGTEYIQSIISDPDVDPADRKFLHEGIGWLNELAKKREHENFAALSPEKQSAVLEAFVDEERGENWLSMVINYLMEALFGDPVYGGNVNEAGWKWIEHHAGFPHPPGRKWYKGI